MTALTNMTRNELQTTYAAEIKQQPDRRWKDLTLIAEIESHRLKVAEQARREAEKEAAAEKARADRDALIKARGDFETYAGTYRRSENDSEYRLSRAVRWAQNAIAQHEKMTADLVKKFAENPANAMSWGGTYFTHAAEYNAAVGVKQMFEDGYTVDAMRAVVMRDVMHKAKYPARSTSPTSNLMEQEELAASTKLLGYLDGSELF
jgi:hypothetical protein